jgi:predicted TIM-barrel fold metal-dependent hydrolase
LFDAYGSRHALVVGPNSGYDTDNRCLLDFLARGTGRFKGVAVIDNDISRSELERLRGLGIVGTTMQASLLGVDHFRDTTALLRDLAALDMFADVQVDGDQLIEMAPVLEPSGVRVLIDHCGRPDVHIGSASTRFSLNETSPFSPTVPSWWHARLRLRTCHTQALTTHAIATPPLSPREWYRTKSSQGDANG